MLQVGSPAYVPSAPAASFAPVPAPAPAVVGLGTRIDSDDNDLTDNVVPQTIQHTAVVRPASVNVQKIKVRPQTQVYFDISPFDSDDFSIETISTSIACLIHFIWFLGARYCLYFVLPNTLN